MGAHHPAAVIAVILVACSDETPAPSAPDSGTPTATPPATSAAQWHTRRSLPAPQQETAVVELGGKVYVIGGLATDGRILADVNVYDASADTWSTGRALPEPLHHVNAAVAGGRIVIAGALRGGEFSAAGAVLVFDPTMNEWTAKTAMPAGTERGASAAAAVGDHVYVAGGLRAGASVADFSRYDTKADAWEDLPALPSARDHGAGAAHAGVFYAFAGRSGAHTARVDAFDPTTRTWSSRAPLPTSRAGFALALREGRAYLFGGEGNAAGTNGMFSEVESYDFAADAWSKLAPMKTPRHGMGAATVGSQIIVPGGGTKAALAATDIVEALAF